MEKSFEQHSGYEKEDEERRDKRHKERYEQEPLYRRGIDAKKLLSEVSDLLRSSAFDKPEVIEELGNRIEEFEKTNNLHSNISTVGGQWGWLKEIARFYKEGYLEAAKTKREQMKDYTEGLIRGIDLMLDEGVEK